MERDRNFSKGGGGGFYRQDRDRSFNDRNDRNERSGGYDRSDRGGNYDRNDRGGNYDRNDRGGNYDRNDRGGNYDRNDRGGYDRSGGGGYDRSGGGGYDRSGGYRNERSSGNYRSDNRGGGYDRSNDRSSFERSERDTIVYSQKVRAGKRRTYFVDVKSTRGNDFYINITESKKRFDESYERHKIHLYKEDFNKFLAALQETILHVKTELMPDYDFDEFNRDDFPRYEHDADGGEHHTMADDETGKVFESFDDDDHNTDILDDIASNEAEPDEEHHEDDLKWE